MSWMTESKAREIIDSSIWESVVEELDERIQNTFNDMRNCDADELKGYQRRIKLFEEIKRLPEDVLDREIIRS